MARYPAVYTNIGHIYQNYMQYCRGYIHALQSSSFYTIIPVYILQTHGIKVWKFY